MGDEAGSSVEGLGRLDPARGGHDEGSRACRHHGREDLERILLHGTGAGGMAGAVGERRVLVTHVGHRVCSRVVALEQAERGTGCRRLGQQEGGQRGEGEATGAQGLEHQEGKVTDGPASGQRLDPEGASGIRPAAPPETNR